MKDKGTATGKCLDMRKVLKACIDKTFEAKIPDHYIKRTTITDNSNAEEEEKLENELIQFFMEYLSYAHTPKCIAKKYGVTAEEVEAVREAWAQALSNYML